MDSADVSPRSFTARAGMRYAQSLVVLNRSNVSPCVRGFAIVAMAGDVRTSGHVVGKVVVDRK